MSGPSFPDSSGGGSVWAPPPADEVRRINFGGMSSAQILAFMTAVMKEVDQNLGAKADVLRRRNDEAARIAEQIAVLERLKLIAQEQGTDGNLGPFTATIEGVTVTQYLNDHEMADIFTGLTPHSGSGGAYYTQEQLSERITALKARQDSLTTNSELDMVAFQSIVQTRQMFVNLATQMMSSEHGAQNNVVQNIGR